MSARPNIIAIANQKGGVGKTTTTINLAAGLVHAGQRVLVIDLDPQGNLSTGLGIDQANREFTTRDVLSGEVKLFDAIQSAHIENLYILPANTDLSAADVELLSAKNRSRLLQNAINTNELKDLDLDFILIDCPPSLNMLTVNALVAADSVIVPLQSEFFALEGLSQLLLTVREVRSTANTHLRIAGVVLTMFDRRNNLSIQVENDARTHLGDLVFQTVIPRNVRLSEAPSFSQSIFEYDPTSKGARAYSDLAKEVILQHQKAMA